MDPTATQGTGQAAGQGIAKGRTPPVTIGRVVIYRSSTGPCPAIVQEVMPGGELRLWVFGQRGYEIEENVAQGTERGEWSWPERV